MKQLLRNKHLVNKATELIKFCFVLGLFGLLISKAPNEAVRIIETVSAFILGGKLGPKIGT